MAEPVETLPTKPDDRTSVPGTYVVEGETCVPQVVL